MFRFVPLIALVAACGEGPETDSNGSKSAAPIKVQKANLPEASAQGAALRQDAGPPIAGKMPQFETSKDRDGTEYIIFTISNTEDVELLINCSMSGNGSEHYNVVFSNYSGGDLPTADGKGMHLFYDVVLKDGERSDRPSKYRNWAEYSSSGKTWFTPNFLPSSFGDDLLDGKALEIERDGVVTRFDYADDDGRLRDGIAHCRSLTFSPY